MEVVQVQGFFYDIIKERYKLEDPDIVLYWGYDLGIFVVTNKLYTVTVKLLEKQSESVSDEVIWDTILQIERACSVVTPNQIYLEETAFVKHENAVNILLIIAVIFTVSAILI